MTRTLPRVPLALSVVGAVLLPVSGLGVRAGLWHFRIGFQLLRDAAFLGIAAALLGLFLLFVPRIRLGHAGTLAAGLVLGAGVAALPIHWMRLARALPMIHDISTDTEDPPQFHAVLRLRKDAPNPATYGGPEVAKEQRRAYPDIQPLHLDAPPISVFPRALEAARAMGWAIVLANSPHGPIEATATTTWFGFRDDVVVRITPEGSGSRVDVRSVSRVGKSDVGANAHRIREYLARLRR